MKCDYDSGSMYGNVPLCDREATVAITYRNGSTGPLTAAVCDRHNLATQGRAYPGVEAVTILKEGD